MLIFNYFLFGCFINLCNSFTLINKQIRPNFFSRNIMNKMINMSCDYYIDKNLCIYDYNDEIFSNINLEHEKGYYFFISVLDEDEDGYDTELAQYIENILEPSMKPIVIYSNKIFHKLSFENKYKKIIENDIKKFNKTLNDVKKIVKIEDRYNIQKNQYTVNIMEKEINLLEYYTAKTAKKPKKNK